MTRKDIFRPRLYFRFHRSHRKHGPLSGGFLLETGEQLFSVRVCSPCARAVQVRAVLPVLRFHCHAINTAQKKNQIGNCPVEEAKKMKCYKRLIYKQFVQISGLCGPQFLSYLSKHFTHLCRALHGDATLVHRTVHQYGRRKSTKTSGVHFFYKSSNFLFTRELAYVRINTSFNT